MFLSCFVFFGIPLNEFDGILESNNININGRAVHIHNVNEDIAKHMSDNDGVLRCLQHFIGPVGIGECSKEAIGILERIASILFEADSAEDIHYGHCSIRVNDVPGAVQFIRDRISDFIGRRGYIFAVLHDEEKCWLALLPHRKPTS